ncbi:14 kDa phosphohistidine phosphatase-like [Eriocheir sinensis]|uniref:14 kDa phosphohistidine phosphatase-like n=1 Tax=Eriocheir sinensis TaxID=95602 RepID=UPI0021C8A6C1|nr:14 kDa phosphohistidine phosphatase-like [Eriocheir sinensis]XP_050731822.1 14 kDa phosphohistidine phosphatase-like [Eriocheir sinensis]XP_050731823.1 14 kDa phosphohistidine phosphatase-like [Eriocheir sinensis]
MAEASLGKVTDVDIDAGTFKYVLIKVCHSPPAPAPETTKYIARGYTSAEYHSDVYDRVTPNIEALGLDCECVGGGRICHQPEEKSIKVYGYSQGYGKADHSITVGLLKKKYPDYTSITFSNDGY